MIKAGEETVKYLQNHVSEMSTHSKYYSKGALNTDLTRVRLQEIAPPQETAALLVCLMLSVSDDTAPDRASSGSTGHARL
jgi:hypothetical protein